LHQSRIIEENLGRFRDLGALIAAEGSHQAQDIGLLQQEEVALNRLPRNKPPSLASFPGTFLWVFGTITQTISLTMLKYPL